MEDLRLMPHQKKALEKLSSGKILRGNVGDGKSRVAIAYYAEKDTLGDLYIITTAKKRDSLEWRKDAAAYGVGTDPDGGDSVAGVMTVDSWNNIRHYEDIKGSTFIFDEQRLVGNGSWVKSFYKIAKNNQWIMLSATPGDVWLDYAPVFIANGYYNNITEFRREHIVYKPFTRFPMIDYYVKTDKLNRFKNEVLVEMPFKKHTVRHVNYHFVDYDKDLFKVAFVNRWNPYKDEPIRDSAELFAVMRRIVYSDPSRLEFVKTVMEEKPRVVIFYNFNYELEILRTLYGDDGYEVGEWNGHRKHPIPDSDRWVYLVQYTSGCEGWNCASTDTMVFYSLNYSYRRFEQAQGRIDRMNTLYTHLSYYAIVSDSVPDRAVMASLKEKKAFNEKRWVKENYDPNNVFLTE